MPNVKKIHKKSFTSPKKSYGRKKRGNFFKSFFKVIFIIAKPIVACGLLLFLVVYLYRFASAQICSSDMFTLEDIEVVGCKNVSATEIQKLIPFKIGDNLLKIDLSKAQDEVQKIKPELKNINMSRQWTKKSVVVELTEREPELFVKEGEKIEGLDFDNTPFALRGSMFDMQIPTIESYEPEKRELLLNFIKTHKSQLEDLLSQTKEIKFGSLENEIIFITKDKTKIYFGQMKKNNSDDKIEKMNKVIKDSQAKNMKLEYIDVSLLDIPKEKNRKNKNKILVKPLKVETSKIA